MKVLNVMSRFNVGGTSQWLYQLSKGLDERGISNLLLIGDCPTGEREDSRLFAINSKKIIGLGPKTSPLQTFKAFLLLRKAIKDFQPDIINTHTSKAGVLGRLAAKSISSRGKIVHTYHGHVLHGYFNPILENLIRYIEITLSLITDLFLVSGEQVLADLRSAGIIRNKPAQTIWPAVPDIKVGDRVTLRKSIGLKLDSTVFGWLGRKVPIKRVDRILDIAKARPNLYFLLAGDGQSVKELYPERFSNGKLKNVFELGFTSPSDLWAIADVCLLTSDNEAMPISPIEAALCSRPVIVTDAGSSREVVEHGQTGFISPKDSVALLEFVDTLSRDNAMREKMGVEAREFALRRFAPQSSIERQIAGYRDALSI